MGSAKPRPLPSPRKAIRKFCLDCEGGNPDGVVDCLNRECPFHPYRSGKRTDAPKGRPALVRVIKGYCHEYCQAGAGRQEVMTCAGNVPAIPEAMPPCPLYPFRLGVNPNIREETRELKRRQGQARAREGTLSFR